MATTTDRDRRLALLVVCTGALIIILDTTIVNVALPTIQRDLGFSQTGLAWVVNAYLIAFGGLLLLAGRLGDLLGRRRMFLAGLALFSTASLACGLADGRALLVGARFVQGIGAAMTSAVVLGIVVTLFPRPGEQARAIGVYSFFQASGGSLGLLLGGVLTQAVGWHWIFFVNVPVGAATALGAARLLAPDTPLGLRHGADAPGAALIVSALMLGVYAIVGSVQRLPAGALALALLALFVARERRAAQPLVPGHVLRSHAVAGANVVFGLMAGGLFAMQFLVPLYLRGELGLGPLAIGLAFLPLPLAIAAFSLGVADRAIVRFGAFTTLLPALVAIGAGLALLARAPAHGVYARDVLPSMLALGIGGGLAIPALMTLAMSGATPEDSGLASGLANTTIQVGGALGLAVLVALAGTRTDPLAGYHVGFAGGALLVAVAASVAGGLSHFGRGGASARSSRSSSADGSDSTASMARC
jgi:EmrB/QacA subfamily drug resistance transporter